jgi:4-diphosphocytidyl-2-C-methyl-D-erythritol kinase
LSPRIKTPAKINLWLEVIRKREDGYHDLSSLMLPVGIYDFLEVEPRERPGIGLECNDPGVPADASNLAWHAAAVFFEAVGSISGIHLHLTKNIPVAAGLGGGSADAAAVLLGLNSLHENCFSLIELGFLAQQLGADVPFFLHRCPALATGIGEKLSFVEGLPDYPLVLIKPPLSVSTRWVYESLKLTRGKSRIKLQSLLDRPWELPEVMENDLESITIQEYPLVNKIKEWLLTNGALGALMSGSGPTVFGVFREPEQARLTAVLAEHQWKECWVAATHVCGAAGTQDK